MEQTLHYVHSLNVCHDTLLDVSVMVGMFQTVRVNVYAHALNFKNQCLTLLKVYKPVACTSTLHTVLVICTTSFRFVQLMYSPLQGFLTTLDRTLHYVHTLNVSHDAVYEVGVMEARLH